LSVISTNEISWNSCNDRYYHESAGSGHFRKKYCNAECCARNKLYVLPKN